MAADLLSTDIKRVYCAVRISGGSKPLVTPGQTMRLAGALADTSGLERRRMAEVG